MILYKYKILSKGGFMIVIPKNITSMLFDLDGTIANTEQYHFIAFNECLKDYNIQISTTDFQMCLGKTEDEIHNIILSKYNVDYDLNRVMNTRLKKSLELIMQSNLTPYKEIKYILDHHSQKKYIVSSQNKDFILALLSHWNIISKFDGIISCHELKTFKHIIYNNLESYFGSTNKTTLLFEDAEAPLSIAKKISIQTVAVQHDLNEGALFSYDQLIVTNH